MTGRLPLDTYDMSVLLDRPCSKPTWTIYQKLTIIHHTLLLTVAGNVRHLSLHALPISREGIPSSTRNAYMYSETIVVGAMIIYIWWSKTDSF